jgi:hypothetical protein
MDPKEVPCETKGPLPKAEALSPFDMFLDSPLDDLPDVDLLQRPEMWEYMSLLKVLHDVYHTMEEQSFPPNERPHWRFVNRLSAELCKVLKLKEKEVAKKEAEIAQKNIEISQKHIETELWRTRYFELYNHTWHGVINANGASADANGACSAGDESNGVFAGGDQEANGASADGDGNNIAVSHQLSAVESSIHNSESLLSNISMESDTTRLPNQISSVKEPSSSTNTSMDSDTTRPPVVH